MFRLTSLLSFLGAVALFAGCGQEVEEGSHRRIDSGKQARRKLIVFHAGSLSVPFREIANRFERERPGVSVMLEAAGSRTCARKISDLGRPCDVMASADFTVIDSLLIPDHAEWNILFACNEMTIVYGERSKRSDEIDSGNWYRILLDPQIVYGRSNPDSDPCGYRAVLTMKLAERHYGTQDLSEDLLAKDARFIRPKETDLLALLEMGAIDYIFLYRSVAQQHGLAYLILPDEINLKNPAFAELYGAVGVAVSGRKPGTTIVHRGRPIAYGVTIPRSAPNRDLALEFVEFLLEADGGLAVMEREGQPPIVPAPTGTYERIPERLRRFAEAPAQL